MSRIRFVTTSGEETAQLASRLGAVLEPGDVILLSGEMGAGKTVFAQGLCVPLGVKEPVNSPTFNLVHVYAGRLTVHHLDLYRLRGDAELADLCWDEIVGSRGVTLVEWPERAATSMSQPHLAVLLTVGSDDSRTIELRSAAPAWVRRWDALKECGVATEDRDAISGD